MKEEQKKRYTEDKNLKSMKGMTSARGSFGHVQTIYTGSDPQTTPVTLGSTGPSSRPDSGFRSRTRSPLEPSSSEQSTESHWWGRDRALHNDQASNFNDPGVMGHQEPQRKQYPVMNSVIKGKSHSLPHSRSEEGTHPCGPRRLSRSSQIDVGEERGTIGCGGRMFVGGGRAMVQHSDPYLSDIQEDDRQYSDTEKDGAGGMAAADHESIHCSRQSGPDEHRTLTQVRDNPISTEPLSLRTHRINVRTPQCAAKPDVPSMQSSPPISIPSRKHISAAKVAPEQRSSGSSSSEQSSFSSTPSSGDGDSDNSLSADKSVATQPKVLQHPSKWKRFKEYIVSSVQETDSDQTATSAPALGVKML